MAKGDTYASESKTVVDERANVSLRQVTRHPSIHHQPFFFAPAYDRAMQHLIFISYRTGRPEIFAEVRATGELVQLTEREGIEEYSLYPSHDGRYVYYVAGTGAFRVDMRTYADEQLAGEGYPFSGTTALSRDDRWWAVRFRRNNRWCLSVIDTTSSTCEVILERDVVAHMMFCPDDDNLLFYAGPLNDRVWLIRRDGTDNRRLYERRPGEWITHESWIPGTYELAFIDWPHGIRCVNVLNEQMRQVTTFNAWHAICNYDGTLMVADTNFPDIGLQLFNPRDGVGKPTVLCYPEASSLGEHWNGTFPYEHGPIPTYAPQHTHPHPSFSPDNRRVVFTSDRTGFAQVYEVQLPS